MDRERELEKERERERERDRQRETDREGQTERETEKWIEILIGYDFKLCLFKIQINSTSVLN